MATKKLPDQAYLRECFDYDPATGGLTWRQRPPKHFRSTIEWQRWNKRYAGKIAGKRTDYGTRWDGHHWTITLDRAPWGAHRLIWKLVTRQDPIAEIDHINRQGDDNRWSNLRETTRQEQMQNTRGRRRKHHDLPMGAFRNGKKFCSRINAGGKLIYLGNFDTAEEAHQAYLEGKKRLHQL